MRVVQVINHFGLDRGGAERLAFTLHCDLLEAGVDAHLLAIERCTGQALQAQCMGFTSPRDPRVLGRLSTELRRRITPDTVVHAHLFPATLHVSALQRMGFLRAPCSMTEHNTWNRRRGHRGLRWLDRAVYRGFDRIIAISDQTQDALLESYPSLFDRTQTILNGATLNFGQMPQRDKERATPCLLSLARLTEQKNLGNVLQALALLKDRQWRYVMAGEGPNASALKKLAQDLGLSGRVSFPGQVMDVPPLLAEADIFLMPSRWEGFGLAAVEAMNAGLPVVASTVPGLREVVAPAGNPVVDPDDVAGLAAEIANLLDDPTRRARLGVAGFAQATKYEKANMTAQYLSLWSEMAGRGSA